MAKEFFIKLTPLNSFYFGSTKEFGDKNNEYFLKSGLYPQQTAVLGMLRKKILEDNELLLPHTERTKEHREKEREFIGDIKPNLQDSTFGLIKKVSTVQIYSNNVLYIFSYGLGKENNFMPNKILTNKGEKRLYNYDYKNFEGKLTGESSNKKLKEFLTSSIEIGINSFKRKNSNIEEKAFFKKERYNFNSSKEYFGFYVSLDEKVKLKNGIVQLGDKYSIFTMEVFEKKEERLDINKKFNLKNIIYFLSDAFLDEEDLKEILKLSEGILVQNNKFKFISRNEKNERNTASLQNLVSRGSMFIIDENKKIINILNNEKYNNYKKIGLNNFEIGGEN